MLQSLEDEFCAPIETKAGYLHGRDAVYLEAYRYNGNELALDGVFTKELLSKPVERDVSFTLIFRGVLALQILELDSWMNGDWSSNRVSSFDEVVHSRWKARLGGKVTEAHRHFSLVTYDEVIDVICGSFDLSLYTKWA